METSRLLDHVYLVVEVNAITPEDRLARPDVKDLPDVKVWLVNQTDEELVVKVRSGDYASMDDGLLQSNEVRRTHQVPARMTILFESDWWWAFDFVVWWQVDLVEPDGTVHFVAATREKYGWRNERDWVGIPDTRIRGKPIRFHSRVAQPPA